MSGTGWKEDPNDDRDWAFGAQIVGASGFKFDRPDLSPFSPDVLNQGSTSACVAFSICTAIYTYLHASGIEEPPLPSPMFTYFAARAQEFAGVGIANVVDEGSFPRLAMKATKNVGFVEWKYAPFDKNKINAPPTPEQIALAYSQKDLAYFRIPASSLNTVDGVEAALRCGFPVIFGMFVDSDYMQRRGPLPVDKIDENDPNGGGHMQTVIAVQTDVMGRRYVLVQNSWGALWGDDGHVLIPEQLFVSAARDIIAIKAAKLPKGE